METEQLKKQLRALVDDFKARYSYYKSLSEPDIETKLIYELFVNILGWDRNDFKQQEKVRRGEKRGRADYGFYLGDKLVFFLEVKRVGVPLDKEADKQVISYALSKRVPFAISTNFEQMKIFCVEEADEGKKIFRVFNKPEDYIENLQDLILLSKESFKENKLLNEAIKEERLKKRISMDKILLDDLMSVRKLIADDIEKSYPKKYEVNDKEEIVQRIIDRLIFIRRCEDVGMNPENLYLHEVRNLPDNKAYPKLKDIFEKYNEVYNSGLFAIGKDNDCDIIKIDGLIIKRLIGYLYESEDKEYVYNFDWIDADVLGQVYEQYLGNILAQTKSGKTKLKDGQAHKKEQGIYYTPTYIVDYIVKNTLVEALKNKKIKPEEIKILDCACGSGSFLIKAFDYLYDNLSLREEVKQHKIDSQGAYSIKTEILKKNIFGIDLDNKAVEITKLNLLLKASEKGRKLPEEVDLHIKHGNSLVSDDTFKYYFRWEGDFNEGSFDVVIGNPPYIDSEEMVKTQPEIREYLNKNYSTARGNWDIFLLFIERGMKLLKEGGYLGMIIPNKLLSADYSKEIRNYLQKYKILSIRDYSKIPVFKASVYPIVIIIKKEKPVSNILMAEVMESENDSVKTGISKKIKQEDLQKNNQNNWAHIFAESGSKVIDKILSKSINLNEIAEVSGASSVSEAYELKEIIKDLDKQKDYFKFINTGTIDKYCSLWGVYDTRYIKDSYKKPIVEKSELKKLLENRYNQAIKEKIIIAGMNKELECYLDNGEYLAGKSTTIIIQKNTNLKVILAILNSKLMTYVYKNLFKSLSLAGGYMRIGTPQIKNLPIKIPSESQEKEIVQMVDKILFLNKKLNEIGNKATSETKDLNDKISNLDKEINKVIYEVYGLNDKDISIIAS